jgi:hypothetical protein
VLRRNKNLLNQLLGLAISTTLPGTKKEAKTDEIF